MDDYAPMIGCVSFTQKKEIRIRVLVMDPNMRWGQTKIRPFYTREQMLAGIPLLIECRKCSHTKEMTFRLPPDQFPNQAEFAPRSTGGINKFKCSQCGHNGLAAISPVPDIATQPVPE